MIAISKLAGSKVIFKDVTPPKGLALPELQGICEFYWHFDAHDKFIAVKHIAKRYAVSSAVVYAAVDTSRLLVDCRCLECGLGMKVALQRRSEIDITFQRGYTNTQAICPTCRPAFDARFKGMRAAKSAEAEQTISENAQCIRKAKILETLAPEAYKNQVYLTLKPVELCVLVEMAFGASTWAAYELVGIPRELGNQIYNKLVSLHLVAWCCHDYQFPDGAKAIIQSLRIGSNAEVIRNPSLETLTLSVEDIKFFNDCGIATESRKRAA